MTKNQKQKKLLLYIKNKVLLLDSFDAFERKYNNKFILLLLKELEETL